MLGKLKKIKTVDGQYVFPITHADAVYVDQNKTLTEKLNEINSPSGESVIANYYKVPLDSTNVGSVPTGLTFLPSGGFSTTARMWKEIPKPPTFKNQNDRLGDNNMTIQGACFIEGAYYITLCAGTRNAWGKISLFYRYFPETQQWEMLPPVPLEHPSGLAWEGGYLWCSDYDTGCIVKYDLKKAIANSSFSGSEVGRFLVESNLSTLAFVDYQGVRRCVAGIFNLTKNDYIIDTEKALTDGNINNAKIAQWTTLTGLQGQIWDGRYLYEVNNEGIFKIDIPTAIATGTSKGGSVETIPVGEATNTAEDLAWDGMSIWMSDEWNQIVWKQFPHNVLFTNIGTATNRLALFDNFTTKNGTKVQGMVKPFFKGSNYVDVRGGIAFNVTDQNNFCCAEFFLVSDKKYGFRLIDVTNGVETIIVSNTDQTLNNNYGGTDHEYSMKLEIKNNYVFATIGTHGQQLSNVWAELSKFNQTTGKLGLRHYYKSAQWREVSIDQR
jgi:hypothetical protein